METVADFILGGSKIIHIKYIWMWVELEKTIRRLKRSNVQEFRLMSSVLSGYKIGYASDGTVSRMCYNHVDTIDKRTL